MNKPTVSNYLFRFLALVIALILAGCGMLASTTAPTSQPKPTSTELAVTPTVHLPTETPSYTHYVPVKGSNIYLEFDYPDSWIFIDGLYTAFSLLDPRFNTLPEPSPDDFHPTPNDFGQVDIWILTGQPGQTLDEIANLQDQIVDKLYYMKRLKRYEITLDGYPAKVFEYQIDYPELYTSLMFSRDIYFAVNDKMYQISFLVSEDERDGEFEKGFEYFFSSIKIVP